MCYERGERSYQLDAHGTHFVTDLDTLVDALSSDEGTKESTRERVPSTVGVDDLVVRQGMHRVDLGDARAHDNSAFGAMCDDHSALTGCVGFRKCGNGFRYCFEVLRVGESYCGGPSFGLGFITDNDVTVGEDLRQLLSEELGNEWSGEVDREDLGTKPRIRNVRGGRFI